MGLLWDYFKNTLRFPLIQKSGPLAMLAHGGAEILDAVRDVILSLRDQFLPTRCEDVSLLHFTKSRGIVRNPLEPDEHWKWRVKFAYIWWALGGRASAMAQALQIGFQFARVNVINLGAAGPLFDEITGLELFDETTGAVLEHDRTSLWAEFKVVIYLAGNEITYTEEQIIWAINEIKPARSKLNSIVYITTLHDEINGYALFDESNNKPLTTP